MLPVVDSQTAVLERPRGVLELTAEELQTWLRERGQPPLRARQIRRWILVAGAESFEAMTDLPKGLRQELAAAFVPLATRIDRLPLEDKHLLQTAAVIGSEIPFPLLHAITLTFLSLSIRFAIDTRRNGVGRAGAAVAQWRRRCCFEPTR